MARHTPGPWQAEMRQAGDSYEYVIHLTDDSRQFSSWGWPGLHRIIVYGSGVGQGALPTPADHEEGAANARLIAAAPELVETVRTLLHIAEDEGWLGSDETNAAAALLARIEGD